MRRVRVFIASPGDVGTERNIIEELIKDLNRTMDHTKERTYVIEPQNWKLDTGPGLHVGGAQGVIDQKLPPQSCDLMIVVLWSRLGEKIAGSNETGTEHEMNLAFERWKSSKEPKAPEIFTYFKMAPIPPNKLDDKQIKRLHEFKSKFKQFGYFKQATYKEFVTVKEFRDILRRDLSRYLSDLPAQPVVERSGFPSGRNTVGPHKIVMCSAEATFDVALPLREIDCVMSCLEDAVTSGLAAIRSSNQQSPSDGAASLFSTGSAVFTEPTLVTQSASKVTLIWELPQGREGKRLEIGIGLLVLDFVAFLQKDFRSKLNEIGLTFREYLDKCNLRVVLSSDEALKRISGLNDSPVYLATHSQEFALLSEGAPPGSLTVNLRFAPYLFMERLCAGEGEVIFKSAGLPSGERIPAWATRKPLCRRVPKTRPLTSLNAVLEWSKHPYLAEWESLESELPLLTEDDVILIFEIRECWESRFASELAIRASQEQGDKTLLEPIDETIKGMTSLAEIGGNVIEYPLWRRYGATFHSQIAELSSPEDGVKRKQFTEWVYGFTKAVYSYGMTDNNNNPEGEVKVVLEEHVRILELMRGGKAENVRTIVRDHLVHHYDRAHNALVRSAPG